MILSYDQLLDKTKRDQAARLLPAWLADGLRVHAYVPLSVAQLAGKDYKNWNPKKTSPEAIAAIIELAREKKSWPTKSHLLHCTLPENEPPFFLQSFSAGKPVEAVYVGTFNGDMTVNA